MRGQLHQDGREIPAGTTTPLAPVPPVQVRKNTPAVGIPAAGLRAQPKALPRVPEAAIVRAVARWLDGAEWEHEHACFRPYHGLNVRLRAVGDQLLQEGVPVVSRNPSGLPELPEGTRTANRTEARALCAVAVRGDAWRYA